MRKRLPLLPVLFLLATISCKKSNNSTTAGASLTGSWNLIDIVAHTKSAVDEAYGGNDYEDVTTSDYTTTNNGGTIDFTGSVANETGLTYSASVTEIDSSYLDGQLVNVTSIPFNFTIPGTSGSTKYTVVGSDSLYFPAGGVFTMGSSSGTQTNPQSSGFTIHGDTLALTSRVHQVVTQNVGGTPATQTADVLETAYFKRQ